MVQPVNIPAFMIVLQDAIHQVFDLFFKGFHTHLPFGLQFSIEKQRSQSD
jgi:hypothetical protein